MNISEQIIARISHTPYKQLSQPAISVPSQSLILLINVLVSITIFQTRDYTFGISQKRELINATACFLHPCVDGAYAASRQLRPALLYTPTSL